MSIKNNTPAKFRAQDLRDLDQELTALLARRAEIVAALKPQSPSQAARKRWLELEKELWQTWDKAAGASRSDVRTWRKVFSLAQELQARAVSSNKSQAFKLTPKKGPVRLNMTAPGCTLSTRLWAVLASQVEAPFTLPDVVRNDSFIELVKALNKAGASLFWDDSGLHSRGQGTAEFKEGVIFAGEDVGNLLLLVSTCLGKPGSQRFTGGSTLKQADLSYLRGFLPQLGARIAFLHPGSSSVPFRLESSGILPDEVIVPSSVPPECVMAICLVAPTFPKGLTLTWDQEREEVLLPKLDLVAALLRDCGVEVVLEPGRFQVPHAELSLPKSPFLPPDPFIAATLFAFAAVTQGSAQLERPWPKDLAQWRHVLQLLETAGLRFKHAKGSINAEAGSNTPGAPKLDAPSSAELLPVALALALHRAMNLGKPVRLALPLPASDLDEQRESCAELAAMVGLDAQVEDGGITLAPMDAEPDEIAFVARDSRWCLALALLSHARPGLELANPGSVAELLPGFWQLFNALPAPGRDILSQRRAAPKTEENDAPGKRRRFRL